MSRDTHTDLTAWITSMQYGGDMAPHHFVILHRGSKAWEEIGPGETPTAEEEIESLATRILLRAETDVAGLASGVHQYMIRCLSAESKTLGRFPFRLKSTGEESEDDDSFAETEPASLAGVCKQMMRHQEAIMRLAVYSQSSVNSTNARTITELRQYISVLEESRRVGLDAERAVQLQTQDHELKLLSENFKQEAIQKGMESLGPFVQFALNALLQKLVSVMGGGVQPGAVDGLTPEETGILSLFDEMSAEEKTKVMMSLSPEHQAALGMAAAQLAEKKKRVGGKG